jgi:hypothetical protein
MTTPLPLAARYFPLDKGLYEVAPGLSPLTRDFGNGPLDQQFLQITQRFPEFRQNKLACRAERAQKYITSKSLPLATSRAVNQFLVKRLLAEHPSLFTLTEAPQGPTLACHHTGDFIAFTPDWELRNGDLANASYLSAFDALCLQFECDLAVMQTEPHEGGLRDWLAEIHLCSPSHWAAEEKIGLPFTSIHAPIPHIEKINAAAQGLIRGMIYKGPFVRFVWGFATDNRLNHHPDAPAGWTSDAWRGRSFDPSRSPSPFLMRLERQVTWGLPEAGAALFGIHVHFIEGAEIRTNPHECALFVSALKSLSRESRVYKSIEGSLDQVLTWLEGSG